MELVKHVSNTPMQINLKDNALSMNVLSHKFCSLQEPARTVKHFLTQTNKLEPVSLTTVLISKSLRQQASAQSAPSIPIQMK